MCQHRHNLGINEWAHLTGCVQTKQKKRIYKIKNWSSMTHTDNYVEFFQVFQVLKFVDNIHLIKCEIPMPNL